MAELSAWLSENELMLILEKGKPSPCHLEQHREYQNAELLCILNENGRIKITSTYQYLSVQLDSSKNLKNDFDAEYKKPSGRLCLLANIKNHLDAESAKAIYCSMALTVLTYRGILNLKLIGHKKISCIHFTITRCKYSKRCKHVKSYHQ